MNITTRQRQVFVTGRISKANHTKLAGLAAITGNDTGKSLSAERFAVATKESDAILCVIFDPIDKAFMKNHPHLKLVANCGVGYNNIDVAAASEIGILIVNTPDVVTNPTADLTFGLILSCARRIVEADGFVRFGLWGDLSDESQLFGTELTNKTLGIIGMGRIGKAVAKRAWAFAMKIVYTRASSNPDEEDSLKSQYGAQRLSLNELLAVSDVISVHCPLTSETRHLVSKAQFAQMKPGCLLINASRGAIIDEKELINALKSKQIGGAGLDVFEHEPKVPKELIEMSNVVLTPHIGTASTEARDAMANLAIEGLLKAFTGELPDNAVNMEVWPRFLERLKQ
jgi:glyoxylate reductase